MNKINVNDIYDLSNEHHTLIIKIIRVDEEQVFFDVIEDTAECANPLLPIHISDIQRYGKLIIPVLTLV